MIEIMAQVERDVNADIAERAEHTTPSESQKMDGVAGADPRYTMPIRIITELAWHNLFVKQLFRRIEPYGGKVTGEKSRQIGWFRKLMAPSYMAQ